MCSLSCDAFQHLASLKQFLFQEQPIVLDARPPAFTTALETFTRDDCIELPLFYLHAMIKHDNIRVRGSESRFELADLV